MAARQKPKSGVALLLVVGFVIFIGFLLRDKLPVTAGVLSPATIVEVPRNNAPMAELTPYFEHFSLATEVGRTTREIEYYWRAPDPATLKTGQKFPLVLVLHGSPGNAYAPRYLLAPAIRAKHPAFVMIPVLSKGTTWAYPTAPGGNAAMMAAPKALPHIAKMIDGLANTYPIDRSRIYVIGCSEGGFGTFGAVLQFPHIFAAAVPISGGWRAEDSAKMAGVPIWAIHGARDTNVPVSYTRDVAGLIKQYGGPIRYSEVADMSHECPSSRLYGPEIWDWMFAQKKSPAQN